MAIQLNGQEVGPIKFTDDKPGKTIHVGPSTPTNPVDGDVWIDSDSQNNAGKNLLQSISLDTAGSTVSCTVSPLYKDIFIVMRQLNIDNNADLYVRINGDIVNYYTAGGSTANALFTVPSVKKDITTNHLTFTIVDTQDTSSYTWGKSEGFYTNNSTGIPTTYNNVGIWTQSNAITSITLTLSVGAFAGGTVLVYGVN
jgi:hypothetical protein